MEALGPEKMQAFLDQAGAELVGLAKLAASYYHGLIQGEVPEPTAMYLTGEFIQAMVLKQTP